MIRYQQDIADFLKAQPGWFRFEVDDAEIPYNFGVLYGLEQFGGGVSSMLTRVHSVLGHEETPRLFGIRYRVARHPSYPEQVEVFESRSGLKVYLEPRIRDPLWSVHQTPCGGADQLRITARQPEVLIVEADMPCAGQLVAGDPWFPGWRAWVDGKELMTSRVHGSEEALSSLALKALGKRQAPRVLVGGLGFGYTLRAALDHLPPDASVVVGEIFPSLLKWNRDVLGDLAGRPLDDRRVEVVLGDVRDLLDGRRRFDAVLLDVDNGAEALTLRSNAGLYTPAIWLLLLVVGLSIIEHLQQTTRCNTLLAGTHAGSTRRLGAHPRVRDVPPSPSGIAPPHSCDEPGRRRGTSDFDGELAGPIGMARGR